MYTVYVLYSLKDNKLYKGITSNVVKRFIRHNQGGNKSTARRKPFVLIYLEQFENKSNAQKREAYIKSVEGGSKLKEYLRLQGILNENDQLNTSSW